VLSLDGRYPRLVNHFSMLDRSTERDLRHTELAAFLPDKRTIGAVYSDGSARAWTWAGTSPATTLRHRDEAILRAGFTHGGDHLTTASSDGTIRVWTLDGEEVDALLGEDDQEYYAAAISPIGDRAAAVGDDGSVSFWALDSRLHHVRRPATPRGADTQVSYSAHGNRLITASPSGSVRIWTADGDADPVSLDLGDTTVLLSARLSPDGAWAATVDLPYGVRVWRTADGELQRPQPGAIPEAWMATFSHDGEEIIVTTLEGAAAHNRSNVIVLDRRSRAPMAVLRGHEGPVYMADSGRGDLAVTASSDHSARVWDFGQFDRPARHTLPANGEQIIVDALFSPSGDQVATLDTSGTSRLWDSVSGSLLLDLSEFPDALSAQEVHLGPDHFATRSADHDVELWPLSSGRISELLWAYSPVCLDAEERRTMMGETRPMARKNAARCLSKVARLRDDGVYAWLGCTGSA
jgi:WD40 repeat protein